MPRGLVTSLYSYGFNFKVFLIRKKQNVFSVLQSLGDCLSVSLPINPCSKCTLTFRHTHIYTLIYFIVALLKPPICR